MAPTISVVIATTCELQRRTAIWRAINSILKQQGPSVELLVVVNGERFDSELFEELKLHPALKTHYRKTASLPAALKHGCQVALGEFVAFLDDDDEYLPGALQARLEAIEGVDWIATNGYVEMNGREDELFIADHGFLELIARDPLLATIRRNWLRSSGGLFRTASISHEYFDGVTKHFEWTLLSYRLLLAGKMCRFVNTPTYRNYDSPVSLSKDRSADPLVTHERMLEELMPLVPMRYRGEMRRKRAGNLHALAEFYLSNRKMREAWGHHLRSVWYRGWRYLAFTRHLVVGRAKI